MNFPQAIKSGFTNYVTFSGRASRSEYWQWILFYVLLSFVAGALDRSMFHAVTVVSDMPHRMMIADRGPFGGLVTLLMFLPTLSVAVRRLHDQDRSGWAVLVGIIPIIGWIIWIIWACTKGTTGDNRYGPDPLV
jgi:uncharacterized membrane protein YhaH (DUF805 family)